MRIRPILILTGIVSSALGAVVVYLVLTVPNDLQANAMMKQARQDLAAGRTARARDSLSMIVQQYPRTDAAAAATVALVRIGDQERAHLQQELDALRRDRDQQASVVRKIQDSVTELKNAPPPAPVIVQAPPKPPVQKPKARPAHKSRTRHHRRRR